MIGPHVNDARLHSSFRQNGLAMLHTRRAARIRRHGIDVMARLLLYARMGVWGLG